MEYRKKYFNIGNNMEYRIIVLKSSQWNIEKYQNLPNKMEYRKVLKST